MEEKATTREEHLIWCKRRALEFCEKGDLPGALSSMISDLRKHPGTEGHSAIELGALMMVSGHLNRPEEMRRFIEGFR